MGKLYIFGHLNPDTDSIVAAISYANLKQKLGETDACAVRLGNIGPETMYVLQSFGFELPPLLTSAKTQLTDIVFDMPPCVSEDTPIRRVWEIMSTNGVMSVPVTDDEGRLLGICTAGDIANATLRGVFDHSGFVSGTRNLCDLLSGRFLCGTEGAVSGDIQLAQTNEDLRRMKGVVIAQWRDGIENLAAASPADCVILCQAHNAKQTNGVCRVIATPYDMYKAARLSSQSVPVGHICARKNLVTFKTGDYTDDVTKTLLTSRFRSYPILNEENRVVGTISRIHLINHARKRVILVDHNEKSQSVAGLEQAEIREIIDHHRLGDVQTGMPMFFRNEPVGSTTTIIASMYSENKLVPEPAMAKLMLAAILSDTVAFRSPTCTEKDKRIAYWLADISETDAPELGERMFRSLSDKLKGLTPQQVFFQDFKEYGMGGRKIGVGQITCWQADTIDTASIQEHMDKLLVKERFDVLLFMVTEIIKEGTTFLHAGDDRDLIWRAFGTNVSSEPFFLTGVMSRKKQVMPALSRCLI